MSDLEPTALFNALSNGRRQHIIREVATGPKSVSDLSETRAREENDIPAGESVSGQQRKRVYVAIYQSHLDKLDQLEIVDWKGGAGNPVTAGANHEEALQALEFATSDAGESSRVNNLLGLFGGVRG